MGRQVIKLFELHSDDNGTVRLEKWPEGLVLWAGGQIRWKSWEEKQQASLPVEAVAEVSAALDEVSLRMLDILAATGKIATTFASGSRAMREIVKCVAP